MVKTKGNYRSLSRRIILQFCLFTLALSVIYSLISFVMMYTLEDSFIEKDILQEAAYLATEYEKTGVWPRPRTDNIELHFSKQSFPIDIRQTALDEPERVEFYGQEQRHYHVLPVANHNNTYVVAEVSEWLYVRLIRDDVIRFLIVSGIVVSLIACVIAWLIGRRTAHPLTQLATLVAGLDPAHKPDKFAHYYPNNEVGVLATALEQSMERMASALEREKCFTRDASHELRTPLAVIKNAAELQLQSATRANTDKSVINRITLAAEQMEKTVRTLLILAREQHSRSEQLPTQLMPIVEQAVLDHHRLLQDKPVEVQIDENCHITVLANPGMLKVLVDNLISNAFQYTQAGTVTVSFTNNALVVKDTGQGIDSAIADQVTAPAVKGRDSSGFGFGLSIVKRLCEHQGWKLNVHSQRGTTVTVELGEST